MPLSSLADAPSLGRPHTANSSVPGQVSRDLSQGRQNRGRIKSQASIDAMFVEDFENRPRTAPNLQLGDTKLEMGRCQDLDAGLESPPSPVSKMGYRTVQKKSKKRAESLAALLGDQILEEDLKSLSYPTLELPEKKSRQECQIKRVAFMDHKKHEPVPGLFKDDVKTPSLLSTSVLSPPSGKRGDMRVMNTVPDKDDEWGARDVLTMLTDGPDTFLETQVKESTTISSVYDSSFAKKKPPSVKTPDVDMCNEFGDYQPSFLSASRRTPLAGRRGSPSKGRSLQVPIVSTEALLEPPVKGTNGKLPREPESVDKVGQKLKVAFESIELNKVSENSKVGEEPLLSRIASIPVDTAQDKPSAHEMASLELSTDCGDLQGVLKPRLDFDTTAVRQNLTAPRAASSNRKDVTMRIDTLHSNRSSSVGHQPASQYQEQFMQLSLDNCTEKISNDKIPFRPGCHHDSRDDLSQGSIIQRFQNSADFRRTDQYKKDDEEGSNGHKAFCDVLLAERNALQSKLDMERDKFSKEKETLQVRLNDESLRLRGEIQLLSSSKEKIEAERDRLVSAVKELREENLHLKDEILRVENERLAFDKRILEAEQSHEDALLNKVEEEKEEAQKLAMQLTSEVQLLKNSSLLAEEKMTFLYKVHEEELQMVKSLHSQELEVKDKHFSIDRKFWSDQQTTIDTVTKLVEKGDEWAFRVDELHNALMSDRELVSSDKAAWLGTMNETVTKAQAALREWGDQCSGVKNQFDQLLAVLESGGREIRTMHLEERERLDKEHAHLKLLQESLQEERALSLAELSASRDRLEEMRSQCYIEKESFLTNCMEELKAIAAEREAVVRMREQLLQAEAALEKQIMEHAVTMQAEASEATKQRLELERAKEMAAEIVQEVEHARQELEQQRQAFEREIASVREFGLQAQQKVESAVEIKKESLQLKLDAEAIRQDIAREGSEIERQRIKTAIAQKELLELKRRHDEERMKLAMERQHLCSERREDEMSRMLSESTASHGLVYTVFDNSKSQVVDISRWDGKEKEKKRKVAVVPTRTSNISSSSKSSLRSGPWVIESVEASLCLQAQEDFLAEASKVLQHTTESTCKLLAKR